MRGAEIRALQAPQPLAATTLPEKCQRASGDRLCGAAGRSAARVRVYCRRCGRLADSTALHTPGEMVREWWGQVWHQTGPAVVTVRCHGEVWQLSDKPRDLPRPRSDRWWDRDGQAWRWTRRGWRKLTGRRALR
jgi:hypothetical protein